MSQVLAPVWLKLAPDLRKKGVRMGQIDGSVAGTKGLMKRFGVDSYPSIFHLHEGQTRQYLGTRTREAIADWAVQGFRKTEALPWYQSPVNPISRTYGLLWRAPGAVETLYLFMHDQRGMSDMNIAFVCLLVPLALGAVLVFLLDVMFVRMMSVEPAPRPHQD